MPDGDDPRQRGAIEPFGDDHLGCARDDAGDGDVGIVGEGRGEPALGVGLERVVEFLEHPLLELGEQRLDLQPRRYSGEQPRHPRQLGEVGEQRRAGTWVLQLDGYLAAVGPHRAVHLADAGRGGRDLVEGLEAIRPAAAELLVEHAVHRGRRHRRGGLLQLGEGFAVRRGGVLGQCGFEHRQRLPEFHRTALELAEDGEQLLGGPGLQLSGDFVGGAAADPLAETDRGAPGDAEGQRGELRGPGYPALRNIAHWLIVQ